MCAIKINKQIKIKIKIKYYIYIKKRLSLSEVSKWTYYEKVPK